MKRKRGQAQFLLSFRPKLVAALLYEIIEPGPFSLLLVQFAFKIIADQPLATTGTGEYLAIMRAVKVTGTIDAATINAIRAQQQDYAKTRPGKVVDGRVSPARGYIYGGALWTIVRLNDSLQGRFLNIWPRIRKRGQAQFLLSFRPKLVAALLYEIIEPGPFSDTRRAFLMTRTASPIWAG